MSSTEKFTQELWNDWILAPNKAGVDQVSTAYNPEFPEINKNGACLMKCPGLTNPLVDSGREARCLLLACGLY